MTPALATRQVVPKRRSGAKLASTARRSRRGEPADHRCAYRPVLLTWISGQPTQALIERMRRAAIDWDRRSLLVSLDRATQVLLLAEDSPAGPTRELVGDAVHAVVDGMRAVQPETRINAVVGDCMAPGERLAIVAAGLRRLARRGFAGSGDELVWARRYSLASLLETVDPRHAAAFVEEQLARVRAYDREHGTNLQRVLELALDHDNRNMAARAAFMHRNTFRRQLARALELIDVDLSCPEERLALHVALKMRKLGNRVPTGGRFDRAVSDSWTLPS